MPRLSKALSRFRRARAFLHVEAAPPGPGAAAPVRVVLEPSERLEVQGGRLQLLLVETYFARTVLDGFHEQRVERVFQDLTICGKTTVRPGSPLELSGAVQIPEGAPPPEDRPMRLQWLVRVRVDVAGRRSLQAELVMAEPEGRGPEVDGRGFLPL